jgi:hypothetical protein
VLPLYQAWAPSQRTSAAWALNHAEEWPFIRPLVQRVTQWSGGHPHWEAPVVTHYPPGTLFGRHNDASATRGQEWADQGGQRLVTSIVYLQNGGGATYFDQLDLAIPPQVGRALFFYPADADTHEADPRTTHQSLPSSDSEKWIVQLFGRARSVPPPLGLPEIALNEPN